MVTAINTQMADIATVSLNQEIKFVKQIDRPGSQADTYEVYPDMGASLLSTSLTQDELNIQSDLITDASIIILFDEIIPIIPCNQNIQVHIHKSFGRIDTQITGLPC